MPETEEEKRKLKVIDSGGTPHIFEGGKELGFYAEGVLLRIYHKDKVGSIASFCNYVSCEFMT